MLRQTELLRVLGRRLTERLVRAGWIVPIRSEPGAVFFDSHEVHLALKRLAREGDLLNGHVRMRVAFERAKVQKLSPQRELDEATLEGSFFE